MCNIKPSPNLPSMGGLQEFQIQFDKTDKVFSPGQVVTGHLRNKLSERQSLKNIKVEVEGKGKVHWVEIQSDPNGQPYAEHHLNSEGDIPNIALMLLC